MKKIKLYHFILVFINIIPFMLFIPFYANGALIGLTLLLFLLIQSVLNLINFVFTQKYAFYLFLNLLMIVSNAVCSSVTTRLYYNNISSDSMTLVLGDGSTAFAVIFGILLTIASLVVKLVYKRSSFKQ